jgi:hypothetical protein
MSKRLDELRQLLSGLAGEHLADETLAEIVTAEIAGESVEQLYASELRHLESCMLCAEAYGRLVEITLAADELAAVTDAGAAAEGVESLWGQPLVVDVRSEGKTKRLRLRRGPAAASPTGAGEGSTAGEWLLLARRMGRAAPLYVDVRARRDSLLTCTLLIGAGRAEPGVRAVRETGEWYTTASELRPPGFTGRLIQIQFAGQTLTAISDEDGRATFEAVPIAALNEMDILIGDV